MKKYRKDWDGVAEATTIEEQTSNKGVTTGNDISVVGNTAGTFNMPTSYQNYYSGCEKERRILIGPW